MFMPFQMLLSHGRTGCLYRMILIIRSSRTNVLVVVFVVGVTRSANKHKRIVIIRSFKTVCIVAVVDVVVGAIARRYCTLSRLLITKARGVTKTNSCCE